MPGLDGLNTRADLDRWLKERLTNGVGLTTVQGVKGLVGQLLGTLESSKLIHGIVDTSGSGSIVAGLGFTVVRNGAGDVTITFTEPFTARPTVVGVSEGTGAAGDIHIDTDTTPTESVVRIHRLPGDGVFHFSAIGSRS